ncbi:MAG: MFS transporter [Deltaproteobacteria bacterium]|nr:MFS transporter [Deltaproteobacteria bacterium]
MSDETLVTRRVFNGENLFLLVSLALGHTLMHCLQQGWYIILPSVKQTFGLSDVQYGGIESIRSASNTAVQIPSGVVSDMLRRQWVIIVVSALLGIGVAYAILGLAPSYGAVLLSAVIIGISIALWHPPALSVLSARLVERRGLALSIHGMGGNLGNAVGPAMMGVIIGAVAWQMATLIMAIPMVVLALLLWRVLSGVPGREGESVTGRQYIATLKGLLRNRILVGLVVSQAIRTMGTVSIFTFFSLYCREDLGFSPAKAGLYFTTMMAPGIVSQPLLGYLSDRFGRKSVLVPSLLLLGSFEILLVWSGSGIGLALVAICIGLFIYPLGAVMQAATMDVVPEEAGATTIALLFGISALFTIPSPTIAGWLSDTYRTSSVFIYSGVLVLLSTLVLIFLPIDGKKDV